MATLPSFYIADANVLIDYLDADPSILPLASTHLGPIHVADPVIDEVDGLDRSDCPKYGLILVEPSLDQYVEAANSVGPLSTPDWICLILARDEGWTCVSNDTPLRDTCQAANVPVLWGLQIMVRLVQGRHLSAADAIKVAETIGAANTFITPKLVDRFRKKVSPPRAKTSRSKKKP